MVYSTMASICKDKARSVRFWLGRERICFRDGGWFIYPVVECDGTDVGGQDASLVVLREGMFTGCRMLWRNDDARR